MISAVMNSALYICYLFVGPLYDRFGVEITQIVSAISYSLGYLLLYLSFIGLIPANAASLAIYYFIAGFGSCGAYMAMVIFIIVLVSILDQIQHIVSFYSYFTSSKKLTIVIKGGSQCIKL